MDSQAASSSLPAQAKCVVIGAGIVGNCLVGHLARLGWKDLVLIDKGPLPNPGGSTGHASNFIFPVDHSREMTDLTADSLRQYEELGVLTDLRRHRGGAHRGADGGAAPPDGVGEVVGRRRLLARDARRDQGARPVRGRERHPARRLLLEERRRGGLAARRHADARGGAERGRAHGRRRTPR